MYWDMNNLYGCAMMDYLPTGGHKVEENMKIEDVLKTPDDSAVGYLVRVDLEFPAETHELLRHYPPAPDNIAPKEEWLTEYQLQMTKICDRNEYEATEADTTLTQA